MAVLYLALLATTLVGLRQPAWAREPAAASARELSAASRTGGGRNEAAVRRLQDTLAQDATCTGIGITVVGPGTCVCAGGYHGTPVWTGDTNTNTWDNPCVACVSQTGCQTDAIDDVSYLCSVIGDTTKLACAEPLPGYYFFIDSDGDGTGDDTDLDDDDDALIVDSEEDGE